MANGWIKLHRLTLEKNIFKDAHTFQVFTYLMLKAAYKEMSVKVGNRNIDLAPGQLLYGRKSVSQKLNMGEGKLRGIMNYLVRNGSIEIETYSKYSIVTIVNWAQYQWGDCEPEFPFDIDFLDDEDGNEDMYEDYADYEDAYEEVYTDIDIHAEEFIEEYAETQPAKNRVQMQTQTGIQNYEDEYLTSREPQYNNINKYKKYKNKNNNIIKNKTKENNKKIKEEKTKKENKHIENPKNITNIKTSENISNIQNMKTPKNRSINRQSPSSVNELARFSALNQLPKVAGLDTSQEMLYPGGGISNGKVGFVDSANRSGFNSSSGAFAAPAASPSHFDDDEYLDARLFFDVDF